LFLDEEFKNFLMDAKKNTYASGNGSLIDPIRKGSKDLPFKKGEFAYMDSYFGELDFVGQEIVWHHDHPIWGMNYYGYTYNPIEGFPDFLFECLKQVQNEAPFRGPEEFHKDHFAYHCTWEGDLSNFKGEEYIQFKNEVIYKLTFHGGQIRYL
jgi:hypothetical protein